MDGCDAGGDGKKKKAAEVAEVVVVEEEDNCGDGVGGANEVKGGEAREIVMNGE